VPVGRELYHRIALLADVVEGQELLVVPSGRGTTLEYFVQELGVNGSGVDEDLALVEEAEARAREAGILERMHIGTGSMGELPHRDGVFDVVIGEVGLTTRVEPERALTELTRVLKPGGRIAVVQFVWKAPVDPVKRDTIASHLGARPLMLVEVKRLLLAAGVEHLHTEDWSDSSGLRPAISVPLPFLAELGLTLVSGRKAGAAVGGESSQTEDLPLFAQSEQR
jgi:SAM-dependent methyltransferase